MTPGIKIRGLRKEFKTLNGVVKVAVENVNLTCFKGHCTVLLGHNGAGKTTTMSMLTGIYAPSKGYAELGGWNIKTSLKEARSQLGLCPQQNTLFSELSVKEHLIFFARLKGLSKKEAKKETKIFLQKLLLSEKKNRYGSELSGGMKRKLCLAIALIGGSKIVILDEPSSGLDPESRRWVWEIVQEERASRTVLLSTHHMEEAEVLGDRIAIMANGKVFCCGSLLFLKNKFGNGYTLSVEGKEDVDVSNLENTIAQYITNTKLESIDGNFFEFSLFSETEKFPKLLEHLAKEKETLGINHIGVSLTTLEQVFFRVGEQIEEETKYLNESTSKLGITNKSFELEESRPNEAVNENVAGTKEIREIGTWDLEANQKKNFNNKLDKDQKLYGYELTFQRFKSLMKKKFLVTKRKWPLFIIQSLIPVAISIICIVVNSLMNEDDFKEPTRNLTLDMFEWTNSSVECNDLSLISLAHSYIDQFETIRHQ
ncbi:Protein lin-52-like protein, partial [Armadillidium nasatum]